ATNSAAALGEEIARRTGIQKDLFTDKTPEGVSRYENIQELLAGMKEFSEAQEGTDVPKTLSDFLIDVALLTDADNEDPSDNDRVSLMTIHSAKGLEFPYVHVVGLEEDLFPNLMAVQSRADLEEERRLFYVAITRAEKGCTLSYAVSRYKWGNLTASEPSRFIDEIDPKYLEMPRQTERSSFFGGFDRNADRGTSKTPPWARNAPGYEKRSEDRDASRPVYGRERTAPTIGKPTARPVPQTRTPPSTAPERKNLKRVSTSGAPLEATSTLGGLVPDLQEGQTVEHERFGKGKVLKIEGNALDLKATVFFPSAGQKQLLLRFAKLTVVEG
ncbi:MAG TPA: ATP-dependent helicase, partial [Flavobacteriales bacterium]|nr:ATP-dependent helicase [Flavobacteriales bacterium]